MGDKNEGWYERKAPAFILGSELITMNVSWRPQDSGGCQDRDLEGKKK